MCTYVYYAKDEMFLCMCAYSRVLSVRREREREREKTRQKAKEDDV